MPRYADIVLPLAQPAYTFALPEGMTVVAGQAVVVQFGARKFYTGIVFGVHDRQPASPRIKSVVRVLYDGTVLLPAAQRTLWEWIASYYMCTVGEVMRAALPALMKPSADSEQALSEEEFRPRTEVYLRLAAELHDEARFHETCERLERRAPKQYAALLEIATAEGDAHLSTGEIARRLLGADYGVLHALERKGLIRSAEHPRTQERADTLFRLPCLSEAQQRALAALRDAFAAGHTTALLHGITGSGKTEIYIHLIAGTLARGEDVLLLVPEIALTAQLIGRLERIFGSRVTAYHSKLTPRRRTEACLRLARSSGGELVVGARSALFLPLGRLGLIVVDEEHDASYKQSDPAPRYNARDCAVVLAHRLGCRTLLGSATPSLESWLNARSGKYAYAFLGERYGEARPPEILLSDTLRAARRGERHTHFNQLLLDRIGATLARGGQAMLFQNRRGFAPYVACAACGWTPRCPECNVTLTYHKAGGRLVCHYCGHTETLPSECPVCHAAAPAPMGFGTEKIEEQIAELFPTARVARLDRDSVTSERAFREIVADFAEHRTDILVGTQMIAKGFDFEGVELVGVLNADNLLHNPDFRASERAFQLLVQVAGRAGRRDDGGEVVIQTSDPANPLLRQVVAGDYEAMARTQLAERQAFFYPPYARLMSLTLRHRDPALLREGIAYLAGRLRTHFGRRVLGPMTPPVDRIRGEYLMGLLLKIESGASSSRARGVLRAELKFFSANPAFRAISVCVDVDPQ